MAKKKDKDPTQDDFVFEKSSGGSGEDFNFEATEIFDDKSEFIIDYTGIAENDLQGETDVEIETLREKMRRARISQQEMFKTHTNANYYSVIYFKSEKQKQDFFNLIGMPSSTKEWFVDGETLARAAKIQLDNVELKKPKNRNLLGE